MVDVAEAIGVVWFFSKRFREVPSGSQGNGMMIDKERGEAAEEGGACSDGSSPVMSGGRPSGE